MSDSGTHLRELALDGYTIYRSQFPIEQVKLFRGACEILTTLARQGDWPYIRTLPKQFPPWGHNVQDGIWGVQHLLHPTLPTDLGEVFAECYFGDNIIGIVKELLRVEAKSDEALIMELFNLLVTPDDDFALRWHRDDISFDQSIEEEAKALGLDLRVGEREGHELGHVQYNIALHPDASLEIIPKSHMRPRSQIELEMLHVDPFSNHLPEALKVKLEPGDIVFYDNNIIHRGVYSAQIPRATLHGSVGDARQAGGRGRARNILQHGIGRWVGQRKFLFGNAEDDEKRQALRRRARSMQENLLEIGKSVQDVGFSHAD